VVDEPDAGADTAAPVMLHEPRDGTPQPLTSVSELVTAAEGLATGHGPVAVDAERASGYRYSQRAYLVQIRREGFGTALIDPIELTAEDFVPIQKAIGDEEWILHAANQDLPCLAELGLRPARLFDTELIGRLLGSERVALGTMLEQYLGVSLEKGHSAADWSTRPLPHDWLNYAALDVELLVELRDVLAKALERSGKADWAEQECQAVLDAPPAPPRSDPWRRTSGLHGVRSPRQLAIVRALWEARDAMAASRDIAPGRILSDSAIIAAAKGAPRRAVDLAEMHGFNGPRQRKHTEYWFRAITAGREVPDAQLPPISQYVHDPDAMPPPSRWSERDPKAAARLAACREAVAAKATELDIVLHNLLTGDTVRRLAWRSVSPLTAGAVHERLTELGARQWQADLLAAPLAAALAVDGTAGTTLG